MKLKSLFYFLILTNLIACNSKTEKTMAAKKFRESDNTAVFTTKFVITDKREITRVFHDREDGAWQFFSNDEFANFEDVAKIVGLGQIIKLDSSVLELADMEEGFFAHRDFKGDKWVIEKSK